jgi:hypothetical protein
MKEYRIQCRNEERYGDKWVMCAPNRVYKTYEEAKGIIDTLIINAKQAKTQYYYRTPITEFRIVAREVGEWEAAD